jgi:actin-related protein 8
MDLPQNDHSKASAINIDDDDSMSTSARSLLVEEVELSADRLGIVILEPGSFNLRFGFAEAEDRRPASIVNCIAYRRDLSLSESFSSSSSSAYPNITPNGAHSTVKSELEDSMQVDEPNSVANADPEEWILSVAQLEADWSHTITDLERVNKNSSVRFINANNCCEMVDEDKDSPTEWANIVGMPDHIVGDQALYLDDDDGYDIFFPFRHGLFNFKCAHMTQETDQRFSITLMHVLDSIERIWRHVVFEKLEISKKDVGRFDVVLVIPDSFIPSEIQHMIDILLLKIGFGHVLLQKSSVCAALGAGKNGICVVNLGFSTTTVCCVDDLEILPGTSFSTQIGGIDISKFLKAQLSKNAEKQFFKYLTADMDSSIQDLIIFEEMKESCCHLDPSLVQPKMYEFMVRHRNQPQSRLFRLDVGIAQFFSPMVLCNPHLDRHRYDKNPNNGEKNDDHDTSQKNDSYRPEDHWAPVFYRPLQEHKAVVFKTTGRSASRSVPSATERKHDETSFVSESAQPALNGSALSESDLLTKLGSTRLQLVTPETVTKHHNVELKLAHLIDACITSMSPSIILQKRMYSQILIVGGSAHFPNMPQLIETELIGSTNQTIASTVNVYGPPSGVDPSNCAWTGASLLVTQAPRELWLDRVAWRTNGLLALREKLTFSWDNPDNRKLK